ncbi:MAG: putative bifunctional diguanylate cyclase/phosphodiesterase [Parasphingopyxis sp.]|nr:EAL domain-containing protein [Sphingomonadales bacterium]
MTQGEFQVELDEDEAVKALAEQTPRPVITIAIGLMAISMFAAIGGVVIANILNGTATERDPILAIALLLNIALILIGWRHHKEVTRELASHSEAAKRARALASRDPLTGFYNRRALNREIQGALAKADQRQRAVALFVIDLDSFKFINDLNGHHIGDLLLKSVASRIADAMPNSAINARLGGDEFATAFEFDLNDPSEVDDVAEMLIERLSQPFAVEDQTVQTSASLGISRSDGQVESVETLLRRADIAMYAAKKQGKNRAVWFDGSMERILETRNRIETGIRNGLPNGEFVPYYEKQIDMLTGQLRGFEVLARWEHPTRGTIMPDEFISVAEECGLITELSETVMRQAFLEAREWDSSLTLSINISPAQLKDTWLAQKIIKLLTETNFPPHRLEIEITETALFDNMGVAQAIISSLKNQGVKIALDDFGTGYSSLSHLRALPFDRIKIDRSFISSINEDGESEAIVDAITRLGESLNLPITAEGVENDKIERRLKKIGPMHGQGWYFGEPMPIGEARELLAGMDLLGSMTPEERAEQALRDLQKLRRSA